MSKQKKLKSLNSPSFKKYNWRDSKLRCLNKRVYFFDNGRISSLNESNQWEEISSIPLFENDCYKLWLNHLGEIKLISRSR